MANRLSNDELNAAIHEAVKEFGGYAPTMGSAIGALFIGKTMGWKVLLLVHNRSTINKYEKLLKIDFRAQMDDSTEWSRKSYAYALAEKTKAFWKLVRGEISHEKRTEFAKRNVSDATALKTQGASYVSEDE